MAHTRKLILMVGESGSGKSTAAKELAAKTGALRISRDDLRLELRPGWTGPTKGRAFEEFVIKTQFARAEEALKNDQDCLIDDTNLNENTRQKWEKFAKHKAEFDIYRILTDHKECIRRDAGRTGAAHVGRSVIDRQFLESGRIFIDPNQPVIIVDVDGTVADHSGIRSPFDESLVHLDKPHLDIIADVNKEYDAGKTILIVSGRHSTCGDATADWLDNQGAKFHHIFMRHAWQNESDVLVKQQILNAIIKIIPKEQIEYVVDDRLRVIRDTWMWNGLTVKMVKNGKYCKFEDLVDF